jgi:hypothetical protein
MDKNDMIFQCNYQMIIVSKHGSWCMAKELSLCNEMDNIDMVILSDYELIGIWITSWKMTIKWLMYSDMGNVDHLLTHPHTHLHPNYLHAHPLTHPPTYNPPYHPPNYLCTYPSYLLLTTYLPTHPLIYFPTHSPT